MPQHPASSPASRGPRPFAVIEVLAVAAIVGILVAIVLPKLGPEPAVARPESDGPARLPAP